MTGPEAIAVLRSEAGYLRGVAAALSRDRHGERIPPVLVASADRLEEIAETLAVALAAAVATAVGT